MIKQKDKPVEKIKYLEHLRSAIDWALSDNRIAWARTIEKAKDSDKSYSLDALQETKKSLLLCVDNYLENWFSPIYDKAIDKTALFNLKTPSQEIWRLMVCLNTGIFDQTHGDLLLHFLINIPSGIPDEEPLYLSPNIDGWGVKKSNDLN